MPILSVKSNGEWHSIPAIKGDPGDPAADESITDAMLVPDGIKTEIDWLWGNQLMDSREGELLHAEDAYTAPAVDISVDGKSTQVTTTGKNLFDVSSANKGGYFDVSTGAYVVHSASQWVSIPLTGSASICRVKGLPNCRITWWNDGAFIGGSGSGNAIGIPEGCDELRSSWFGTLTNPIITIDQPIDPYESYTGGKASPNPDYPQPIVSVDELALEVRGKNLIPTTMPDNAIHAQMSGATIKSAGNAWVFALPCARNTDYYFSSATNGTIGVIGLSTSLPEVDGAYTRLIGMANYKNWAISTGENDFILIQVANTAQFDAIVTNQGQLELGSTATDYEPYQGTTVPLYDGTLRSLPDGTKDTLALSYLRPSTREGWAWYSRELVQRVHEITLNTCAWLLYSTTAFYTRGLNLPYTQGAVEVLCNIFKASASKNLGGLANAEINSIQVLGRNELGIKTASEYQDVSAFVASLDDSDVAVAKLATPITTQLDPIELPVLPAPTCTVGSDPATNLKMTYIQDTNLVIESLEATVADMATS